MHTMWSCQITHLEYTPEMDDDMKSAVDLLNSNPRYKFWLIFPEATSKKEVMAQIRSGEMPVFLFNTKHDIHRELEYMFFGFKCYDIKYPFDKVIKTIKKIEWNYTPYDENELGNYYIM